MAIATMGYTGPADGLASVSFSHSGLVTDANAPYFFQYYRTIYGNYFDGTNVTFDPKNPIDGSARPVATDAQIFDAYCQGVANSSAALVQQFIQQQAAAQAIAQVQAVTVTQQT